ncbi:sensor histidine kinase [Micromonospora auratinigra]|uniref:Histidine kinase-, DNA gyrase B-, and HSP90-like ATPase n=1 Tax=Micromonospora auratinigra TaxID=261654 RepID=A0A1A8ZFT6_9ACTN|nr:ATP-binding protein [Micromonospora auratinigra]SBT42871.1 Histidine kinase-, DNA gyrase B-, and HSP90-like ATPase [Micromonospora auratinigra]
MDSLRKQQNETLKRYEERLRRIGSGLVTHADSRAQCLEQARRILHDVYDSLRDSAVTINVDTLALSQGVGRGRAAANIHPKESLRAAAILYEVVMDAVEESEPTVPEVLIAARALHHSIMARMKEAACGYAGLLLNEIQEAHLSERRRVALELHDRVGSLVSVATHYLQLHEVLRNRDLEKATSLLGQAEDILRSAMENVRSVTADMRANAHAQGLQNMLREYIDSMHENCSAVSLVVSGDERWIPPEILDQLALVIREALRNALQHAEADTILARVEIAPHLVTASVEDNGQGFTFDPVNRSHAGISSMRERVSLIGGTMSLTSDPRAGTSVEISVPLGTE